MLSKTSKFRYYIPLCPRPKVLVTADMLDKLQFKESDSPIVTYYKNSVQKELSWYLDSQIVKHSPHVVTGSMVRNGVYTIMTSPFYFFISIEEPSLIVISCYMMMFWMLIWNTDPVIDESRLHDKYEECLKL